MKNNKSVYETPIVRIEDLTLQSVILGASPLQTETGENQGLYN